MAIDTGIALDCAGLVEVGGIQNIFVTDLSNITDLNTAGQGAYDRFDTVVSTATDWAMFQVKPNTATWNTTSAYENGLTVYTTTLQWYIPNITQGRIIKLKEMENACIVAIAEFRSGTYRTIGISEPYPGFGDGNDWLYNDTYARMTLEDTSGSDFVDGNGATVTLTATSFEVPRAYTGTVTPASGNQAAAVA